MKLKKFANPRFLEQIGRGSLALLLARFEPELAGHGLAVPKGLDDETFYREVATMAVAGPGLPERLADALHGIETMASDEGRERLAMALPAAIERRPDATHADFATQVLLAQPELFAHKQEEVRITGLSSFEYYGSTGEDRSATFTPPDEQTLRQMRAGMDAWLALYRGSEQRVTDLEMFELNEEWVFLIRRGDACRRMPMVEGERVTIRQFRPARDVVVAYSPKRDELRLHGRSARELRMLRELFGWRLFGDLRRFSARRQFTLEPLRAEGAEALIAPMNCGIEKIGLREWEVQGETDAWIWKAVEQREPAAVPAEGKLLRAVFEIHFTGQKGARPVQVRAGHQLRMSRHCDATAVHRWLTERGFRCADRDGFNHGCTRMETDEWWARNEGR
jgi:hypothetical protein